MLLLLIFACTTLLIILLLRKVAARWLISLPLLLVIFGFTVSEILISQHIDLKLRHYHFATIYQYFFIPILIFTSAYRIDITSLKKQWWASLYLSLPTFLITFFIASFILYFLVAHASGFPWLASALTVSALCATQSRMATDLLKQGKNGDDFVSLLNVESLFTGVLATVLFLFLLSIATQTGTHSTLYWLGIGAWQILGGIAGGVLAILLTKLIARFVKDKIDLVTIVFLLAYLTYIIGREYLAVSGAIALFVLGLTLNYKPIKPIKTLLDSTTEMLSQIATLGTFLLLGIVITYPMFVERWYAILLAIIAMFIARSIAMLVPFTSRKKRLYLSFSGMRGELAVALAFLMPESIPYWWTVQSIVFGVVLFSLIVQTPILTSLRNHNV